MGEYLYSCEKNSFFSYEFIKENYADWQAFLERISDFLLMIRHTNYIGTEKIWWKKGILGVEFFNYDSVPGIDQHPKMHHFRSSNFNSVVSELKNYWALIEKHDIVIPTHVILQGNENEKVRYKPTSFLDITFDRPGQSSSDCSWERVEEVEDEIEDEIMNIQLHTNTITLTDSFAIDLSSSPSVSTIECEPPMKRPRLESQEPNVPSTSKETNAGSFFTQEACIIHEILGYSTLLSKYDNMKNIFKLGKRSDIHLKDMLINAQSQLQTQVLKAISTLKQDLTGWDRVYMLNNDMAAPSLSDYQNDAYIANIQKKIKTADILLKKWNIYL